ncbi:MAG: epoxide hydrolase [Parvibaculaceae bacterium]|nr:epoxide hydrolase [Parvibaculaceae bacterium]
MAGATPFKIDIPQQKLDEILARVRGYTWHEMPDIAEGGDRWAYGTDMAYLKELCAYWTDGYDWRARERELNRYPHFKAKLDDLDIHFIHVKGSGAAPATLLLTHGWPGSFFEFYDVIDRLAHPGQFGGNAEDGVNLVIPSLPGYAFSSKPGKPIGPRYTATLWDRLMRDVLGYDSYIAQGGDWGSLVTGWLGYNHSPAKGGGCEAIHLNMMGLRPAVFPETGEEKKWAEESALNFEMEGAYFRLHATKPQTLSYGMMDSPVGAAGWIIEKFHTWSDKRAPGRPDSIENAYSKDQLLTNLMLYLVTGSFNTATWFYRGFMEEGGAMAPGTRVEVPTAVANFPKEFISWAPRSMVGKGYNIVRWTDFEHGGHFAAMETKATFAGDVAAFVRQIRG